MGDNTTYRVNDDGSVTVSEKWSEYEQYIIEIFRIEKFKGGVFASRRMKKRALKYARSVQLSAFKVEKLMLDNYPEDFSNYRKTTGLIVWGCIASSCFIGMSIFAWLSYDCLYHNCYDDFLLCVPGVVSCLMMVYFSIRKYKKITTEIKHNLAKCKNIK